MLVRHLAVFPFLCLLPFACGGSEDADASDAGGQGNDDSDGISLDVGEGGSNSGTGGSGGPPGPYELPDGFTPGDKGGWLLGDEIVSGSGGSGSGSGGSGSGGSGSATGGGGSTDDCGTEIIGIVRDFKRGDQGGGHPDFEQFHGGGAQKGLVADTLSAGQKPVFSGTGATVDPQQMTTADNFEQWYTNVEGVNRAYLTTFSFEPNDGVLTFQSSAFFPLDGEGWGDQGQDHNFGFTTEVHTKFVYNAGDTFSFTGDDDLWVFINSKLALDLGGLHPQVSDSISLDALADELGIEVGKVYSLDLFHAERHSNESNFRVDTTLEFTSCDIIIPDNPTK